jgi:hypothetical protein
VPAPAGTRPPPDFSKLPPTIAASLARLAGRSVVPASSEEAAQSASGGAAPDGKPSES